MRLDGIVTDGCVIRPGGVFDGITARRVEALLASADPTARFQLDLTQVGEFYDFAIAVLANALSRSRARVEVRGLRRNQIGFLRHFGVETEPLERAMLPEAA